MTDYDMTQNKNAANYSIQPGYSVDYPKQGTPMDPSDHPATNVPDATNSHWGTVINRKNKSNSEKKDQTRYGDYNQTTTSNSDGPDQLMYHMRRDDY